MEQGTLKLLPKSKETRHRHYKGGIYYKLADAILTDKFEILNTTLVYRGLYESTMEPVDVFVNPTTGNVFVNFKRRRCTREQAETPVVVYQSEESGEVWVRVKTDFEGFNEHGVKRFILANA